MICISVIEKNISECLKIIESNSLVELRFDEIQPQFDAIESLFKFGTNIVATCRKGVYSNNQRFDILKQAIICGARYVDIEIESEDEYRNKLIEIAKQYNCKVIISYHNSSKTPDVDGLMAIKAKALSLGCDIVKIVTIANNLNDIDRVLSIYENKNNLIAFAMGESAKMSRVLALYLGAPFTYAAVNPSSKSAAGQMSVDEMRIILKSLKWKE